ncbi:hypothetical protein [Fredinandcohnia sp. 179-A 10B2 NHS]|uniref:hypothetical protein n=1 Tax=Fredinandcohnia sp. 179-A 10B2 NHS TaxID=3235176 RepID=UPI0039A3B36A
MRLYVIVLLHFMIWSGFSIAKWLSRSDSIVAKGILLLICCYFAFLLATKIGLTRKLSLSVTGLSFFCFFLFERIFWTFY